MRRKLPSRLVGDTGLGVEIGITLRKTKRLSSNGNLVNSLLRKHLIKQNELMFPSRKIVHTIPYDFVIIFKDL
jgi:hypothetical protein